MMTMAIIKILPARKRGLIKNQSFEEYIKVIDTEVKGLGVLVLKESAVPIEITDIQTHLSPNSGVPGYVQFTVSPRSPH
jgi:hypothetical protein